MSKLKFISFILLPALFLLDGCAPRRTQARSLMLLKLGMTKQQVVSTLGYYPDVHRGSMMNKYGQIVDVWEYSVASGGVVLKTVPDYIIATVAVVGTFGCILPALVDEGRIEYYWLFFHNDILVQWGKAGDWDEANRQIHEIRFR